MLCFVGVNQTHQVVRDSLAKRSLCINVV